MKIKGIGAIMIYANDPAAMSEWYKKFMGISTTYSQSDGNYYGEIADEDAGRIIHFGIYSAKERLTERHHSVMINYEVEILDEFVEELKKKGVKIEDTIEDEYGRFAFISDLEGNPIEIWQQPQE